MCQSCARWTDSVSLLSASKASEAKPEGMGPYLRNLFEGKQCR